MLLLGTLYEQRDIGPWTLCKYFTKEDIGENG